MSLNCFWRLSRHCASTSFWTVLKNSATSTAASESSSFYSAQTCKFSKDFSNRHSSCIGKAMSPVSCYHMVCRLNGSFKPYAASLLLQRKSQFSSEEKHTTSTASSVARASYDPPYIKTGRVIKQKTSLNAKGWQASSCNSLELWIPTWWWLTKADRRGTRSCNNLQTSSTPISQMKHLNSCNSKMSGGNGQTAVSLSSWNSYSWLLFYTGCVIYDTLLEDKDVSLQMQWIYYAAIAHSSHSADLQMHLALSLFLLLSQDLRHSLACQDIVFKETIN